MKTCKECGKEKPLGDFANAGTIKGVSYYRHTCKLCYNAIKKERAEKTRRWYIEYKKTLSCVKCGNNDYRVIEFHHTKDKTVEVSKMIGRTSSIEAIMSEIDKCIPVCANCHRIITFEDSHGSKAQ